MRFLLIWPVLAFFAAWSLPQWMGLGEATGVAAKGEEETNRAISYEKDIEPILLRRCKGCHDEGEERKGDFNVTTYETFMKGGQGGKSVKPGKSNDSLIIKMMLGKQKPFMPPRSEEPMAIEDILLIKKWIDQGAKGPNRKKV